MGSQKCIRNHLPSSSQHRLFHIHGMTALTAPGGILPWQSTSSWRTITNELGKRLRAFSKIILTSNWREKLRRFLTLLSLQTRCALMSWPWIFTWVMGKT